MVNLFETFMQAISALVASFFSNATLLFAPLTPAMMFGYSVFDSVAAAMGDNLGVMIGIASALTLEGAGYMAFENAGRGKGLARWVPVVGYFAIGVFIVVFVKASGWEIGVAAFTIVALVYYSHSQKVALNTQERKTAQSESVESEREHELKLAKLAAQKEIALAKVSAPSESFQKISEGEGKLSETFPTDSRRFTAENWAQLRQMLDTMSRADVAKTVGVSERTVTNWSSRLS